MPRNIKDIYLFIYDENKQYYYAKQQHDGSYTITKTSDPYPIKYNPSNLFKSSVEFATNSEYFSMTRSVNYPLDFIKDGAAILREAYHLGRSIAQNTYLTIIEWNGSVTPGKFELSYNGRFDFSQKEEDPKTGTFTIPITDDSAWGILSRYDKVQFAVDCSQHNPKAIKVLIDGITLENRYTFQTVQSPIININADQFHLIPFVLINQDGDSSGIIARNQTGLSYGGLGVFTPPQNTSFLETMYSIQQVNFSGTFTFEWSTLQQPSGGLVIFFSRMVGTVETRVNIFNMPGSTGHLVNGKIYSVNFDFDVDLVSGETFNFVANMTDNASRHFTITPIVTNIFIKTKTKVPSRIVYGLRPLDLLQDLVNQATFYRYTIDSTYYKENNKRICLSGDSLRQVSNAKLYSSFEDFFKTFDAIDWLSLRSIKESLWMEKATESYKDSGVIIDLGEALEFKLIPAIEFYCNEVEIGSPKQDLRHPSGRLEFNSTNTFSLNFNTIDKKLSLVTTYLLGCYDASFLILDYQNDSTTDNTNDKKVFVLDITDEFATAVDNIENFENVNIDDAILEPIIKSPLSNEFIVNTNPIIKGIAPVGSTVNIYADNVFDGTCVSDANGNWSHILVNALSSFDLTHTGQHVIDATFTDEGGAKSTINVLINSDLVTPVDIIYPQQNDSLYNNKPLIKGTAPFGQNIDIVIDSVLVHSTVADNSGNWEYKSDVIGNGNHTISVNGVASHNFTVDSNVENPIITYIGSELDGFPVINNLPLIEGVAKPFVEVTLWLSYISYQPLGKTISDANGNWSFQVVPVNYNDPTTGFPIVLAPIKNGLNIISTDLVIKNVGINVTGYKLNRPNYTSITGVPDNTVFNTMISPKHMLENHYPRFAAMLRNQPQESLYFQKEGQNANLVTVLNGITTSERGDIGRAELGEPFAILEYAKIKVTAKRTFIKALQDFRNGGLIKFTYNGRPYYGLCIGSMKMSSIIDDVQEWKVLLSTKTSLIDLLNSYKTGLTLKINKHSMYRSNKNSLHMVEYDFQANPKYHTKTIYQDWFENRNEAWSQNPSYIQKYQTSEIITDQIITNGLSTCTLRIFRCSDAFMIASIDYESVQNSPIYPPEVVLEAKVDFSDYPLDQYFFIIYVGDTPVAISERVQTKSYWPKTILFEANSSINEVGIFYSTGFKTIIRVEGLLKKDQPVLEVISSSDNLGNTNLLYGSMKTKKQLRYGTAYGTPDYLYTKIADCLTLDNLLIDNVNYVLDKDEQITPSDDIPGHPLYYYQTTVYEQEVQKGKEFIGGTETQRNGVVLVADSEAFGLPAGNLINITLNRG